MIIFVTKIVFQGFSQILTVQHANLVPMTVILVTKLEVVYLVTKLLINDHSTTLLQDALLSEDISKV